MSWSGTRNWHPAQDRSGRSSAVHSQPNRKCIQHHANISLKSQAYQISFQPKRINKSWNTISKGHNFIPSSLIWKLHPFITWFYSLSARKADYTTSTCHVIQRKLGCSSNEKNKNAHWMSPKKVGQQLRIGHMWKHFCSKFTPRDYTNYPHRPMDGFLFLLEKPPVLPVILGPVSFWIHLCWISFLGWWLKLEKSSWGLET